MTDQEKYIEEKINKTMGSVERISRAQPVPFFYTRVKAKLYEHLQPEYETYNLRPAYQWLIAALLILFLAINVYTVTTLNTNQSSASSELETLMDNYYPQNSSIYNLSQQVNQ